MNTKIDRKKIISEITKAAKDYKQNLVGKTFLYVFDNRYIEVMFKTKDFKHLTGVDTNLSAQDFYKKAHTGTLQTSQIFFSSRHPYKLAQKKLKHLQNISSLAMGESFMLEDIRTHTASYAYGTTDLAFSLCLNKEYDSNGVEQGDCFIAESLRDGDSFSKSNDVFVITHTYSKSNDKKKYDQEIYCEQNHSVHTLPVNIKNMLSEHLIDNQTKCDAIDANTVSSEITDNENDESDDHTSTFTTKPSRFDTIINQKIGDESRTTPTNYFDNDGYDGYR